jgi:signal transduction histidine kinase
METVLRNLLENAILYSDGSPVIHISLTHDGEHSCMALSDQGRGIELGDQKKIFNMFYRARRKDENIRGTGLGLFIVQATVKRHHGQTRVESKGRGKGSTFKIMLPLVKPTKNSEEL